MSKKIAVIDKCMTELSEKGVDIKHGFGDDTLNTSVYIARQVNPAALAIHYVTALGTDSFSQQILDAQRGEDVDTSLTQQVESRLPGPYYIEADSTDERTFYCWRNEITTKFWLKSEQSAAICEELANLDYLYLSGISLAILNPANREELPPLLRGCRTNGGRVTFDSNCRPRLWISKGETQQVYQQMLECTDIALLTLDDEDALWGQQPVEDVIARAHNAGVREVVVECGADSCLVSIAGEGLVDVPAVKLPKEKVVDTTAAGDSFNADYLAVRLTGEIMEDAAKRGHLTASTVIQYRGTIIPRETMPA